MSHDPFTQSYGAPAHQPTNGPRSNSLLVILGSLGCVGILMCLGGLTIAYLIARGIAQPSGVAELPERGESPRQAYLSDADHFNRSLSVSKSDSEVRQTAPEVWQFIRESIDAGRDYTDVPFSDTMFIEAVAKSPHSGGSLGLVNRFQLRNQLETFRPCPDHFEQFDRIIEIEIGPRPDGQRLTKTAQSEHKAGINFYPKTELTSTTRAD